MFNSILTITLIFITALFSQQLHDDFLNMKRTSIVMLTNEEHTSGGTGFYLETPSGKIVTMTNGHVCGLAKNGLINSSDGVISAVVKVIAVYQDNDLCIVEAPKGVTSGLKLARSVREGENISVLGHPLLSPKSLVHGQISGREIVHVMQGYDVPCEGRTFHKEAVDFMGFLSGAKYACVRSTEAYNVTANILPGNSGSPVLDIYGHVVGVAFAGSPGTSRGCIVPLDNVMDFLEGK